MAERETIRHLITKGFLVVITTINLLGIFSTGYSDVSRELITSMIYILSLFFILDFQIIFYRYRLKDFVQMNQ